MTATLQQQLQEKIDKKTKPLGALGQLESVALQIGLLQNTLSPVLKQPTILVFAADHGIAQSGVSAYPQEVTYQMVLNFLQGGAAINVFCQQHHLHLITIDAGVNYDFPSHISLVNAKVAPSTQNFLEQPAMTQDQLEQCFIYGKRHIQQLYNTDCNIVGFGEMGIGNTSSATLLMSVLCEQPIEACVGRGTGLNNEQLKHKIHTLQQAKTFHQNSIHSPMDALQIFGGFEIAQMCAAMLEAFEHNMIIIVDGFIASSAFLVAYKLKPDIINNAIFSHLSDEQGHQRLLHELNAKPLLQLNMRLGEGTGCAVAYPLIQSAVNFLNNMASFDSANVTDKT